MYLNVVFQLAEALVVECGGAGKCVMMMSEFGADLVMDLWFLWIWELSLDWYPNMVGFEDGHNVH